MAGDYRIIGQCRLALYVAHIWGQTKDSWKSIELQSSLFFICNKFLKALLVCFIFSEFDPLTPLILSSQFTGPKQPVY